MPATNPDPANRLKFLHRFLKGDFRRGVLTLFSGTSAAALLSFALMLVLTRLFDEAMFGVYDAFEKLLMLLFPFASLRYEDALMLPKEDQKAGVIWGLAAFLLICFALLLLPVLYWAESIATFLGAPELASWLYLLPPTLLVMRFNQLCSLWLTRRKAFVPLSIGHVIRSASRNTSQLGSGLWLPSAGGLVSGLLIGHSTLAIYFARHLRSSWSILRKEWSIPTLKQAALRYRRFALFSTPSTFLNNALSALPTLMVLYYFGPEINGQYGRAVFPLAIPLSLLGTAVSQVFFIHAAEALRIGSLSKLTSHVHNRLALLGTYPTLAFIIAGPELLELLLGPTWRTAGMYLQILAPWILFAGIASPLTRLFDVLERQKLDLWSSLAMFIPLLIALVWGGRSGHVWTLLWTISFTGVFTRLCHLGIMLNLAKITFLDAVGIYLRAMMYALPGLLLLWGALTYLTAGFVAIAGIIGGLFYGGLVLWQEDVRPS